MTNMRFDENKQNSIIFLILIASISALLTGCSTVRESTPTFSVLENNDTNQTLVSETTEDPTIVAKREHYENGEMAFSKADYDKAYEEFIAAGDYEDAAQKANESLSAGHYAKADVLFSKGNYEEAISEYIKAGDYSDSRDKIFSIYHLQGEQALANEEYDKDEVICKYPQEEFLVEGDIVINSTGTGTLGRVGFIRDKSSCRVVPDSHVTTIRVGNNMSALFLYVYLKYIQATIEEMGTGTTNQKELSPQKIRSILIPLPPLKEQLRITNKLKVLLSALS